MDKKHYCDLIFIATLYTILPKLFSNEQCINTQSKTISRQEIPRPCIYKYIYTVVQFTAWFKTDIKLVNTDWAHVDCYSLEENEWFWQKNKTALVSEQATSVAALWASISGTSYRYCNISLLEAHLLSFKWMNECGRHRINTVIFIFPVRNTSSSWLGTSWGNREPPAPWWQSLLWPPAFWFSLGLSRLYSSWKLLSVALWSKQLPEGTHDRDTATFEGQDTHKNTFNILFGSSARLLILVMHNP